MRCCPRCNRARPDIEFKGRRICAMCRAIQERRRARLAKGLPIGDVGKVNSGDSGKGGEGYLASVDPPALPTHPPDAVPTVSVERPGRRRLATRLSRPVIAPEPPGDKGAALAFPRPALLPTITDDDLAALREAIRFCGGLIETRLVMRLQAQGWSPYKTIAAIRQLETVAVST